VKVPKKVKIGGFVWQIITDDQAVPYEGNAYGSTHFKSQKIFLDPENTEDKNKQAFVHEIMHVIWWQAGLTERYGRNDATKNIEEEIIQALSMGLHQVIKDNKLLNKNYYIL